MKITWKDFAKSAAPAATFILKPNQTVYRVALDNGVTVDDILAANGGLDPRKFQAGVQYKLPAAKGVRKMPAKPTVAKAPPAKPPPATPSVNPKVVTKEPETIRWEPGKSRKGYGTAWGTYMTCDSCGEVFGLPDPKWKKSEQVAFRKKMDEFFKYHQDLAHGELGRNAAMRFAARQKGSVK